MKVKINVKKSCEINFLLSSPQKKSKSGAYSIVLKSKQIVSTVNLCLEILLTPEKSRYAVS